MTVLIFGAFFLLEFKLGPPPPGKALWQKTPRAAPSPSPPSMLPHSAATLPRMRRFSTDSDDVPLAIPSSRNQDDEQVCLPSIISVNFIFVILFCRNVSCLF